RGRRPRQEPAEPAAGVRRTVIPGRAQARTRNLEVVARDSVFEASPRPGMMSRAARTIRLTQTSPIVAAPRRFSGECCLAVIYFKFNISLPPPGSERPAPPRGNHAVNARD